MSGVFTFELTLEERRSDRVYVAVLLAPADGAPATLDGVAVQLFSRSGEPVSARMLLPIAGTLAQPMVTTVELRAHDGHLPTGSQIVGTLWIDANPVEATCPADMWTELESHIRGTRKVLPDGGYTLRALQAGERALLARVFPWLGRPVVIPFDGVLEPDPSPELQDDDLDALCDEYGLCDEDAEFLRALMNED